MRKITKRGFTLVELMIVVAIIGVLAALAIFGVRKYLANAKTSEAKNTIGAINRSAVAAYNRETSQSAIIAAGQSGSQAIHSLCGAATAAVPASINSVKNKKYQPNPGGSADFMAGNEVSSWRCLKFTMTEPIYFQYQYTTGSLTGTLASGITLGGTPGTATWLAEAQGDLDGDGTTSQFLTGGTILNGEPIKATEVQELNPEE